MAERGLAAPKILPTPKATRAKITDQTKAKEPSQKNPPKQNPLRQTQPLEPRVVVVPVEQAEDQDPHNPQDPPPHILTPHLYKMSQQMCHIQFNHKIPHHKCQCNHKPSSKST